MPRIHRWFTRGVTGLLLTVSIVPTVRVAAQAPSATVVHDERWQPWLGCWKPAGGGGLGAAGASASGTSEIPPTVAPTMICIVPSATATGVSIVNFAGGAITERTVIDPALPAEKTVGDCKGTEQASWSRDGNRVFLRGTFTCGRGVTRTEHAVMSMSVDGDWVQAQSATVNGRTSSFVARFTDTGIALEGIADGAIVERPILDEAGRRLSPPRSSCTGTEAVTPSADSARVSVRSDYTCAGLHRVARAEFAKTSAGAWRRTDKVLTPFGSASVRADAGAPVTTEQILEVATKTDVSVAEAWLVDRNQSFDLNGKQLLQLADKGMPSRLIDMMVAMSHPEAFAIRPNDANAKDPEVARRERERRPSNPTYDCGAACRPVVGLSWLYDADRYYGWGPFGYMSPYGMFVNRYGYYGGMYGYPYYGGMYGGGYYGPGYYSGGGPTVIITRPVESQPAGRAVYGQGYTRTSSGGSSSSGSMSPPSRGSSTSAPSSSGGSSGGASSGSSSGGSGGGEARTAKPRGGG